jgi:hypothetical protein
MLLVPHAGRLGCKLQQRLRVNDRVCRGRVGRDCKGGGNWDSTLNKQLWAQTVALTNTGAAIEWAATKGPESSVAAAARYGNLQLRCAQAQDWECLSGRKLMRGRNPTAVRK